MRNRAKCKLCQFICESSSDHEVSSCTCQEIFVAHGQEMICGANEWENFIRIDDEGNEFVPKIMIESDISSECMEEADISPIKRKEALLTIMKGMIDSFENLPSHALLTSVTQYDLRSALLTIYEIIRI